MKKLSLFIVLFLLNCSVPVFAYDGVTFYGAQITGNDRYNSSGDRLTSVRDILRQDRANYYTFQRRDKFDQGDGYFSSKKHREIFETAKISISPSLARKILSRESVLITVFVLSPNQIDIQAGLPTPGVD